jgi:16S rRNA processing protein RimM
VEPLERSSYLAVAYIVRARGNRGEVLAELHTDFPARFNLLEEVWLAFPDRARRCFKLEECWEHKGRQVLKFAGVDSITAAEQLVGAWVEIEAGDAVILPKGTYYDHDLAGCRVIDQGGRELGIVKEVLRIPGNNQLVVESGSGEFLIPAKEGICKGVSVPDKRITVDLPEGLMDLNR